jgi:crotonobetainyl-CoA:carnitine CoA-transferase CaiB-like acyl-CoA transferase
MLSGLASLTGYGDGVPIWSSVDVNYPDQVVSLLGAGLVAYSWQNCIGTHIDMSQRETISWTLAAQIEYFRASGKVPTASGNQRPGADPHDVYECARPDTWIAIGCFTDRQRDRLGDLVGAESSTLDDAVRRWAAGRDRDDCLGQLRIARIPCAPVLTADERARHPHFALRRTFLDGGPGRRKGFPLVLEGFRPADPAPAPALGEHTELVLGTAGDRLPHLQTNTSPGRNDATHPKESA